MCSLPVPTNTDMVAGALTSHHTVKMKGTGKESREKLLLKPLLEHSAIQLPPSKPPCIHENVFADSSLAAVANSTRWEWKLIHILEFL